jgi:hypothetical protein
MNIVVPPWTIVKHRLDLAGWRLTQKLDTGSRMSDKRFVCCQ